AARATAPGAPRMLAREALVAALEAEGGNVARAAARLGIARSTLRYRLGVRPAPRGAAPAGPAAHRPAVARWEQRRLTWLLAALPVDMPGALERLTSAVETFGGRVEEAGTRQILVVFGLPPVEDAPERAALCAFTLGDARVVLHSARASIVRDDSTARIDLADKRAAEAALDALARATGDTADVVADLSTAHQLRLRFRLEPYGEDTGPAMFRVVGPDGGGRRPRGSPFVGRARERDLLLDRLRVARHGRGQIAAVAADAGMGKSRLVAEFVESIGDPDVLVLEGRCVAHAGAVPYTPVRDLVRQLARVNEGDPLDVIAAKLAALAESLDLDATAATSVLLSLLGAAVATTPLADLTPEAVRKRITETVLALVLGAASRRPVVVVIEDLHWADRSSEAWLGELVERVPGAAMLVVLTYRPGARPAWLERPDVTRMALAPLANDEAARIVSAARHAGALSDTAVETIVAHGDGNPFFLEELTRTVAESGPDAAVPDTVAGVLIARIDRLTEPSRQVLRAAAILGREFSPTLLAAISDGPIEDALADLVRRDFLHERGDAAERRYRFRHALTQEVAYETVADVDRRAGHLAAARALESLPGEQRELAWDQIARHYARTDDSAKAVTYHAGLAERAARRFAHQEAIAALQEGLRHAARLRDPARTTAELRLSLQLAFSYSMLGHIVEILPLLEPLAARLGAVDDRTLVSGYQFRVALTLTLLGRHAEGAAAAGAALAADPTEPTAAGRAHYVIALNHYTTSAFRDARAHAAHAMEHLRGTAERHWLGLSTWIFALSALALGDLPAAREAADRVAALGDVTEDRRLRSVGMSSLGLIQTSAGDYDDGRALCRQALAIAAADPPARMLARSYLGLGCLMSGDAAEAVRHLDEALVEARALRVRYVEVRGMAWLAEALVVSGELGRARPD
ncbi:MAG TPA: AAA family ATPase, partial [Terriglobales bacterium]|nr:AAA family ATPase [Terriglobales bacterium]